ncbi:hypothetical protein [uncultured Desulfobacter sp.]|nr:hypothetical protein [uncultured Desulfobacter sp.]
MQTKKNMRRASVDEQRLPSHEDFEGEIFLKKTIRIVDNPTTLFNKSPQS